MHPSERGVLSIKRIPCPSQAAGAQRGQSCSAAPGLLPTNYEQFGLTARSPLAHLQNCNRSLYEGDLIFKHSFVLNLICLTLGCFVSLQKQAPRYTTPS